MKKRFIVVLCMMLMFGMFFLPNKAAAKTVTTKYSISEDGKKQKVSSVKRGTHTLKMGEEITVLRANGFVKFKAPKTKAYTFTLSDVKSKNGKRTTGYLFVKKMNGEDAYMYKLKSKGCSSQKNIQLRVGSEFKKGNKKNGDYLKKRSGKTLDIIEKGTILYIDFVGFKKGDKLKLKID